MAYPTVLWQLLGHSAQPVRCELDSPRGGEYRVRLIRGELAFDEKVTTDRREAILASMEMYRGLKEKGWLDTP